MGESARTSSTPVVSGPSTKPATRNSTAVDRIVRFASADTSTAASRTAANVNSSMRSSLAARAARSSLIHVGDGVAVPVDALLLADAPVGAVPEPQDDGGQQGRHQGTGEHGDLDATVQLTADAEGELTDQQRDGEADAGQHRQPEDVDPGQTGV